MEESATYQFILAEGETRGAVKEARRILILMGEKKFGASPDAATRRALNRIAQLERLESLGVRLLRVESWKELLQEPAAEAPQPRRRRSNPEDT
jgi:hypothetical protein